MARAARRKWSIASIELAQLLESAAQVVARDAVQRINLHRGEESVTCVGKLPQLIVSDAEIDVRFDPVRREFHHALVIFDGFRQRLAARFAIQRRLEKILGRGPGHRVQFRGLRRHIKRESPLPQERIERSFRSRWHHVYIAAQFHQTQFLHGPSAFAKLFFD